MFQQYEHEDVYKRQSYLFIVGGHGTEYEEILDYAVSYTHLDVYKRQMDFYIKHL